MLPRSYGQSCAATHRHQIPCAGLRERPTRSLEHQATVRALRATAPRIQSAAEADQLQAELTRWSGAPLAVEVPASAP